MYKPNLKKLKPFIKQNKFPTDIIIETHTTCNYNCVMCPQSDMKRSKGNMTFELWKKIIDEIAIKSPNTKIWPAQMGEPLLMGKKMFDMIQYASNKNITVRLNTNMSILNNDIIEGIFNSKVAEVIISLDGATKETYENIRRGGNFNNVIQNINTLLNEKKLRKSELPKTTLQFILMDENIYEVEMFKDIWKNKDVFIKLKPRTGWGEYGAWQGIKQEGNQRDIPCTWLLNQMVIFWDGNVPLCDFDFDGKVIMGNIEENSLEEVWMGKMKDIRDKHLQLEFDYQPCDTCVNWQAGLSNWIDCKNT